MRKLSLAITASAALTACAQAPVVTPINGKYMAAVIAEIKQEVGDYRETSAWLQQNPSQDDAKVGIPRDSQGKLLPDCGDGTLNFEIEKVTMELTTSSDNTFSAEFAATIPVAPIAAGGPDLTYSNDKGATQKLTFIEYPTDTKPRYQTVPRPQPRPHGPITETLLTLRKALLQASMMGPCFNTAAKGSPALGSFEVAGLFNNPDAMERLRQFFPTTGAVRAQPHGAKPVPAPAPAPPAPKPATPAAGADKAKPDEDSFSLGITVTDVGGGKLKLSVAVVTLGVGDERKSVSGNTITVTFKAAGGPVFLR